MLVDTPLSCLISPHHQPAECEGNMQMEECQVAGQRMLAVSSLDIASRNSFGVSLQSPFAEYILTHLQWWLNHGELHLKEKFTAVPEMKGWVRLKNPRR